MGLISQSIPNLMNGVSQQPATLRLNSQGELQENGYSSLVEGLKKRPPTYHTAKVINGTIGSAFIHTINRDVVERYKVIITDGDIKVFDLAGVAKTVNTLDDTYQIHSAAAVSVGSSFKIYKAPGETSIDFTVSGFGTATIKLQGSVDGSAWSDLDTRTTNGTTVGINIGSNVFIRANITAWTSGTIVATVTYKHVRYLGTSHPGATATNAAETFRATTIADFTFLLNKESVAAMDPALSASAVSQGLIYVRQGNYSIVHKVYVDDVEKASYTTSNTDISDIRTDNIAEQLRSQLVTNLGAGWTVAREGSTVKVLKDNAAAFKLRVTDSNGDRNTVVVKEKIQKFSDLPNVAPDGFILLISGDPGAIEDDYYVKFQVQDAGTSFGRGVWVETLKPGIQFKFSARTMPHILVRESDGTFTFKVSTWTDRVCGDETSVLNPSFVGSKINDIFFYRNRLGLLSDENLICSRSGEYFAFWPQTVTAQLDNDPIDVASPTTKVAILRHAVATQEQLILFSDQQQFVVKHGDVMTPKSTAIDQTTEFENSLICKPVAAGKNIYFVVPKGSFAGVREYYADKDTATKDAADITAHVPSYIPAGAFKLTAATNEDILCLLTTGHQEAIYTYKYYWSGNEKLQSAWSKWLFGTGVKVLNAEFIEMSLSLAVQREDGVYLETLNVEPDRIDTGLAYEVLLDRKLTEAQCVSVVYDSANNWTTWTLPYAESGLMRVVTRFPGAGAEEPEGLVLTITRPSSTTVRATGDWTDEFVNLGKLYTFRYRFSTPVLKERAQSGAEAPISGGRLQIRRYTILHDRTGYYKVEVTPKYNDIFVYKFTGKVLGSGNNEIGSSSLETGSFKFPVMSKNDRFTADIVSDSHLPVRIQSAEWEGLFVTRSQRA